MRKTWFLLCLSVMPLGYLFSQGHWDDQIPAKNENQPYAVFGSDVNVREKADTGFLP